VAGLEEIGGWLVRSGGNAVVQEPRELRDYVAEIAIGALEANKN